MMMFILSFFLKSDDSFLCCIFSCCLCNNCFVNETESGYSDERKSEWIALDQITYDIFYSQHLEVEKRKQFNAEMNKKKVELFMLNAQLV